MGTSDDEKISRLVSDRSNRHQRLYKKALAKSRVRDFTLVSLIGIGSVVWTGTEKFNTYLRDHVLAYPEIIEFNYRFQQHEQAHKQITDVLSDHEKRIRELEGK